MKKKTVDIIYDAFRKHEKDCVGADLKQQLGFIKCIICGMEFRRPFHVSPCNLLLNCVDGEGCGIGECIIGCGHCGIVAESLLV